MKFILSSLIFIQLLASGITIFAQPGIRFKQLSAKDGLAGDIVYALHQDKEGFLWIGTHRGLNRYDGYRFRLYAHNPSDSNSISGNHVHCIKEDANSKLWLATNKGLNSLDPKTGKITRHAMPRADMSEFIKDLLLINDSLILLNADPRIYVFNKKRSDFTEIQMPAATHPFTFSFTAKFTRNKIGDIYLAGECVGNPSNAIDSNDAVLIDWQQKRARYIPSRSSVNLRKSAHALNQIYFDAANNCWAFSDIDRLITERINGNKTAYVSQINNPKDKRIGLKTFFEEPGERLWIGTTEGLVLYDYKTNKFCQYQHTPIDEYSIYNNNIGAILKDRKGVYWIGTFGAGLCYFKLEVNFKSIAFNGDVKYTDRKINFIKTLSTGRIIIRNFSNENYLIEKNKTIQAIIFRNNSKFLSFDSAVLELTDKDLHTLDETDSMCLLGLLKPKQLTRPGKLYVSEQKLYEAIINHRFVTGPGNKIWITSNRSLFNAGRNTTTSFQHEIVHSAETKNDLLIATKKGLYVYDKKLEVIKKQYLPTASKSNSIGSSYLHYVLPDNNDNLWIATADAGFDYWNRHTEWFSHYSTKEGLADNTVYMMMPDKRGRLWLSTNKGLSCFDTATKQIVNYDQSDGLINTEFNSLSGDVDNDGTMYFGGMNGIDYFHPDSFLYRVAVPSLYLSSFKLHGVTQSLHNFYKLATNDNSVSFELTTNDFLNAGKAFFRYKLKGVDADWIVEQGINQVQYSKLNPGHYTFTAQASYDKVNWSNPLIVAYSIATPWYQSGWFFTLLFIALVTIIYLAVRFRFRQQLKLLQVRNRIHRDLHDDIGASLSSVKAYSEILTNDPGNTVVAGLIKESAAEMIEQLDVIAWAANPQHDSFASLLEKINNYARPVCAAKKNPLSVC